MRIYHISKHQLGKVEYLISQVAGCDVISIDIFDTSIIRLVSRPEDIFKIVSGELQQCGIKNFYQRRILAQEDAEKQYGSGTNIEHIYDKLVISQDEERIIVDKYHTGLDEVKAFLIEMEVEQEIKSSIANESIIQLINYCNERSIKVFFLSDMYLTSKELYTLLRRKGFIGDYEIIVSCETGKTKANGSLYEELLKNVSNGSRVIHIGDNFRSDVLNAVKHKGVCSVYMSKELNPYHRFLLFTNRRNDSDLYSFGYNLLGPVFYSFCMWIYDEAKKNEIDKLFFLTREGAFIKSIYDIVISSNKAKRVPTDIFFASRRSLVSAMSDCDWNLTAELFRTTGGNLQEFGDTFEIDPSMLKSVQKKFNIDAKDSLSTNKNYLEIIGYMRQFCEKYSRVQRNLLLKYMRELGMDHGKIGVVDIGWNGTMQSCIVKLFDYLNVNTKVYGLYFSVWPNKKYSSLKKEGYLCSSKNTKNMLAIKNSAYVLENIMMVKFGTTLRYQIGTDDKVYPVTRKEKLGSSAISLIQEGILDFCNEYKRYEGVLSFPSHSIVDNLLKVLENPPMKLAVEVGDIHWSDLDTERYIAKPNSNKKYLFHPKSLLMDIQSCGWNSAFCKRLFRVPLPYFQMYCILKKYMA